ncbi:MAG: sensor histidine kinase [Aureispira sp.]|nr:sensor histidine kinase [Aureispira sp.]
MRFCLVLLLLSPLYWANNLFSQDPDSALLADLDTAQSYTTQFSILNSLSKQNFGNNPQRVCQYALEAIKLTLEQPQDTTTKNNLIIAYVNNAIGFQRQSQYDSAVWYLQKSIDLSETLKTFPQWKKAMILNNIGVNYTYMNGKLLAAAEAHLEALKIREAINDKRIGSSLNNLGLVYENMEDLPKALDFYKRSAIEKKKRGLNHQLPNSLNNISRIYEDLWQIDSAIYYQEKALKMATELGHKEMISNSLGSLTSIYITIGQHQKGLSYGKEMYKIKKELGHKHFMINALHWMTKANLALGRMDDAKKLLDEATFIGVDSSILSIHYNRLASYYLHTEQYDSANKYFLLKNDLENSTQKEEINKQIRELETQYETEKKQRQIELLNKDNELQAAKLESSNRQFWLLSIAAILLLAFVIALAILYHYRTKTNQQLRELNATKDRLFALIAHDLKNPLSAFRSITQSLSSNLFNIPKDDIFYFLNKLNKSSDQLYGLLQNLLQWAISQTGDLSFEPNNINLEDNIREVANLLQLNAEERKIELNYNIPEGLHVYADEKMLKTIIRNLTSNAIKFTPRRGQVSIEAKQQHNEVIISIKDTGIGLSKEDQQKLFKTETNYNKIGNSKNKGTGLGLILCKELIEKHGGKIWVESELDKGSIFNFSIPNK